MKHIIATVLAFCSFGLFGIAYMAIIFETTISNNNTAMLTLGGVALLTFCFSLFTMFEKE